MRLTSVIATSYQIAFEMGNFFTKNNQVSPLIDGQQMPNTEITGEAEKRWYQGWFCCDERATRAIEPSPCEDASELNKKGNLEQYDQESYTSETSRDSELEIEDCDDEDTDCAMDIAFHPPKPLQLASDRAPLPKIEDNDESKMIKSRVTVKMNEEGQTRAIAYNIEFLDDEIPNRPASRLSMNSGACRPKRLMNRLPILPSITKHQIERKVSVAAERKDILMKDRSEKLHQKSLLSKEMLQRLEAEKQRLLKEKLEEKERRVQRKKERLRRRREAKVLKRERRVERTKANAVEREREGQANAEETLRNKMVVAEENKREIVQEQERKQNAHRYKQIQTYLRSEKEASSDRNLVEDEAECDTENKTKLNRKPRNFQNCLHLQSKDKREEAKRSMAMIKEVKEPIEKSWPVEENPETTQEDAKNIFEDESEIEKDSFWDIC